jgi:hypothetical protein
MRGAKQIAARKARDNYPTPPEVAALLPALLDRRYPGWDDGCLALLEPSAGRGNLLQAFAGRQIPLRIAVEVSASCRLDLEQLADRVHCPEDFRFYAPPPVDLVVANPPYRYSSVFLHKSLRYLRGRGLNLAAFLLPLSFLGSTGRHNWLQEHPLTGLAALSERPSFTGDGGTDAVEYAWMIWAMRDGQLLSDQQWIEVV